MPSRWQAPLGPVPGEPLIESALVCAEIALGVCGVGEAAASSASSASSASARWRERGRRLGALWLRQLLLVVVVLRVVVLVLVRAWRGGQALAHGLA